MMETENQSNTEETPVDTAPIGDTMAPLESELGDKAQDEAQGSASAEHLDGKGQDSQSNYTSQFFTYPNPLSPTILTFIVQRLFIAVRFILSIKQLLSVQIVLPNHYL